MRHRFLAALPLILLPVGLAGWTAPADDEREHDCAYCREVVTTDDFMSVASPEGIAWYGLWEDAVAEVERSGRPLMLHFASPRCEDVPGVW